jgi:hypothetical protein
VRRGLVSGPDSLLPRVRPDLELTLAAIGSAALLAVAYGSHVVGGGFYNDDWTDTSFVEFTHDWGTILEQVHAGYAHRPLFVVYDPVLHALAGPHPSVLNAWSLVLAVFLGVVLWRLLRTFALPVWATASVVALTLIFPFADATRLWSASSHMTLSLALCGLGILATLRALDRNRPATWRWHVIGAVLYLASLALFEVSAGLIAGAGVLYLIRHPGGRAVARWAADVVLVSAFVLVFTLGAPTAYERPGISGQLENVERIADQAWTITSVVAVPFWDGRRDVMTLLILAIALAGLCVWRFGGPVASAAARRWLAVGGLGVGVIAAGYVPFIAADPDQYQPLFQNGQNRVNAAAAPGYALLLTAGAALVANVVALLLRRIDASIPIAAAMAALVAAGMVDDARRHVSWWDQAWDRQQRILASIQKLDPRPPPNAAILTFGHPGAERFGIPVLGGQTDVTHALRLTYGRSDITGAAVLQGTTVVCGRTGIMLEGGVLGGFAADYGQTVFIDVSARRRAAVATPGGCAREFGRMNPGPVFLVPA